MKTDAKAGIWALCLIGFFMAAGLMVGKVLQSPVANRMAYRQAMAECGDLRRADSIAIARCDSVRDSERDSLLATIELFRRELIAAENRRMLDEARIAVLKAGR